MKTFKALIVDDEPKLRKVLELKLQHHCSGLKILAMAENVDEAYEKIQKLKPHLVFLDIAMPGASGFELLDRFETLNFEVIFVTGYNDYVLNALKVSAIDYLLKPIITEELIQAVNRAKERITNREKIEKYEVLKYNLNHLGKQETKIAIPGSSHYDFIKISDIIRCEGWQKYTRIFLQEGSCIVSSYNLGVFKEMLTHYGFYNTHKSHLINTRLIKRYLKEGIVVMNDRAEVPVARRKKEEFTERVLQEFLLY